MCSILPLEAIEKFLKTLDETKKEIFLKDVFKEYHEANAAQGGRYGKEFD